jgi:hypothetical protein
MKRLITTALALALVATPALANPAQNGNDWASDCAKHDPFCLGYARGFADGVSLWNILSPETAKICIPNEVLTDALTEVALRYIKVHPESRTETAGILMSYAFVEAWPCKA